MKSIAEVDGNCCMWGTPISLHETKNFNGVLVFADIFFRWNVFDTKLNWVYLFKYVQFNNSHYHLYH